MVFNICYEIIFQVAPAPVTECGHDDAPILIRRNYRAWMVTYSTLMLSCSDNCPGLK